MNEFIVKVQKDLKQAAENLEKKERCFSAKFASQ